MCSFEQSPSVYPDFMKENFRDDTIPGGWKVLKIATGDLNSDGLNDIAVVYESKDSLIHYRCFLDSQSKIPGRSIVVYLQKDGHFIPFVQNHDLVARADEGGMLPYLEPNLEIKNLELSLSFLYTRSSTSYHFKHNGTNFELIRAYSGGISSPGIGSFESTNFDFNSKKKNSNLDLFIRTH